VGLGRFSRPTRRKKSRKAKKYSETPWGMTRDANQIRQDFARWPDANIRIPCACRKSKSYTLVMQPAQDWKAKNTPCPLNRAR
jgi:hypothetical protein